MNPILKAHLEGVKKFEEDFLVEKWPSGYEWGVAPDPAMVIAFLTTYGINLLKAVEEAGPEEKTERSKAEVYKIGKQFPNSYFNGEFTVESYEEKMAFNSCRSSFHSAIDEGIEGIKNN